jgi:tetratricopeptide (TPR) repeat protein
MTAHQNQVSVFLSYAHEDEPLLRVLEKHLSLLKRQELISTWYDRQIAPGSGWSEEINQHLEQASIILLLVSPDFLASDYCYEIEMQRALERHEAGEALVIPIIMRPVDWKGASFARLQALPTDARAITIWSNQDEAFVDVVAGIRRAVEDLPLLSASASRVALPAIWNIPYPPNPFFLGRDDLLSRLHTQLQAGQTTALSQSPQAISGLGGIGKTQIAIEYAYRYHQEYEVVLWARAESEEALISSYSMMASLLKLSGQEAEVQVIIEVVKRWLQTHHKWLLILDNADDLDLLPPFLPTVAGGHILITTRAWDMQRLATRLEVETLSDEQGALLQLRRAGLLTPDASFEQAVAEELACAMQLTKELGGLPLALDQAGAYLEATGMSIDEYHRIYQQHRRTLLQERRSRISDHPAAVATTWSLSFERVEEKNPAAADLLRFCAYLAPDAIPEEIITQGVEHLGPLLEPVAADAFLLAQAVEALRAYSLVSRNPRTRTLSMHRLVQAVLRDSLPDEAGQQWKQRVVLAVNKARPDVQDVEQWDACEQWLPHALVCAIWIEQEQMISLEAARLLNEAGYYLDDRARYREAEPLYKRALTISEQQVGAEHPDTATSLNNLALLYKNQGKYEDAEPLYERALAIKEQQLGADHPSTALSLNNLALLYHIQGKYGDAEPLYRRALAIHEQQLGAEHPNTATNLNNLAELYRAQGKYTEAEPLLRRALAIREQRLGADHPNVAQSLNNLAVFYYNQGKYAEAEPLYRRALAVYEQQLGANHPTTQTIRENYVSFLQAMGRDGK